jgi:hypothetical protein
MAETSRSKPVTKQELDIFGVSVGIVARVGDKTFSTSVSPIDFEVFKGEIYKEKLWGDLIKRIEYDLAQPTKSEEVEQ